MRVSQLPYAHLEAVEVSHFDAQKQQYDSIQVVTDEALAGQCGVRIAFTGRAGGMSSGAYQGLNLAMHVGDDLAAVQANRLCALEALGAGSLPVLDAHQIHGDHLVFVESAATSDLDRARREAEAGADGFVVTTGDVAVMLCFADCVPVAIVSPSGAFALVHAGWRGVVALIAPKAANALAALETEGTDAAFDTVEHALSSYNVYLGPYIHGECFEVGEEVHDRFVALAGTACAPDARHIDLGYALVRELVDAGICVDRIADAGICTACNVESFYSYRAEDGVCGRHGAIAFREKGAV